MVWKIRFRGKDNIRELAPRPGNQPFWWQRYYWTDSQGYLRLIPDYYPLFRNRRKYSLCEGFFSLIIPDQDWFLLRQTRKSPLEIASLEGNKKYLFEGNSSDESGT